MKKIYILQFVVFISYVSFGQNFVLKGVVNDAQNNPVSFSNIVLLLNNNIEKGVTSNQEGEFIIENIKRNTYVLKVSFLGYESFEKEIKVESDLDLGSITLKENVETLDGVTVVAKKPTVKRLIDRLVFNVENSTLSNNNVIRLQNMMLKEGLF